jgi:hypothetical protein
MAYRSKHLEESQTSPRRLDSGGLRRASRLTLLNPSHDLADRRGAAASLFSGRLPGMTQSVVLPYPSLHLRIDRKRSGSRASGAVRGSRLINPRSHSRRGIEGITRVRIGASGSGSPPRAYSTNPPLKTSTISPRPLVTSHLSIKLLQTMGAYKGRTNVKHRKRRSAKAERIKAISATKEDAKKTA